MANKINYLIITNPNTKKKLVYYPVAKNANSSVKLFLIKHLGLENKFYNLDNDLPRYLQTEEVHKKYKDKRDIIHFLPSYTKFQKIEVDIKCCLVRDPIKRFISAYKNRILYHQDIAFKNHSIDLVIEKLENNIFENRHFLPQNYWLGNDLKYFDIIANTSDVSLFVKKINSFFQKEIIFPRLQLGGGKFEISLDTNQNKKIKKIYQDDYDLIKDFNN